ncbi:threonine ammonia-lyase IlvA [Pullulanibacillus sp. KACC 23026]|uniref:threonine ammonia-lyase IlvA n=1 Tax=Pullulanibacillus sp. KACC 23026 TaxID=3028315 RepID=UPI0023B1ECCA|nr:threonine ammonia-lyase IlvA [Pullulanibacillus sp. KACC 23026]WEG12961.1 threonine ammonia-lyase IlvA [Pullulanibacillus sp. KACC 23026]
MTNTKVKHIQVKDIFIANHILKDIVIHTPVQRNDILSKRYECEVYLKREDFQLVRSFKLRGAYYLIQSLSEEERQKGVVCASAGNHAQGVAYACKALGIKGKIFMPTTTPRLKVSQVKLFGGEAVEVVLTGDSFDDSYNQAVALCEQQGMTFIHPFDDYRTIVGQGTVGLELMTDMNNQVDFVFLGIGGGGLASGVGSYVKSANPQTQVIGVEPSGAAGMKLSLEHNQVIPLDSLETFVDGAAVRQVGQLTREICQELLDDIVLVPEGKVCTTILELYNESAIVAEPAGALSVAALDFYKDKIKGKTVVCVISGGNNDINRMQEIQERSLIYEGLKHYFIVNFPQRPGALREFMENVLSQTDDITRFEYTKKTNKDQGPVLVGIELSQPEDYQPLIERMVKQGYSYIEINKDPKLFNLLI